MTPSLYDLLDVEPDASEDEIRAAWKAAIAELDPTDRRFRAYSDAASVLLDPEKRAAYDAELADALNEVDESEADTAEADDVVSAAADATESDDDARTDGVADGDTEGEEPPAAAARQSGGPLVVGLAILAVICLGLALWAATWSTTFADRPKDLDALRADQTSALAAAETIAQEVLSYDHRSMDPASIAETQALMTPAYAQEWGSAIATLRPEAEAQEAVVIAGVRGTALSTLSPDGNQAQVVVFADQLVQKGGRTDAALRQMATLRLIRLDGRWLLERICTQDGDCEAQDPQGLPELPDGEEPPVESEDESSDDGSDDESDDESDGDE